jgi:lysozyme family protein
MRGNYPQIQSWIGLSEGGFVDHPKDPGGATDRGITQATFDAWRRQHGLPLQPVRGISKVVAEEIIAQNYLNAAGCDNLPSGIDYAVGDYAVNSGVSRAVKDLQRVLGGLKVDGVAGSKTLAAASEADVHETIQKLCERRMAFLRRLRHWPTFGVGWTKRVMGRFDGAQTDDIGVLDRAILMADGQIPPAPRTVAQGKALEAEPKTAASTKTVQASFAQIGTAAGAGASALAALDGPAQIIALAFAGAVALLAIWIMRDRLKMWAEGVR